MEIYKNNKKYFYNTPLDKDYTGIVELLSDLDINRCRINKQYCIIFSKNRILSKLKKHYKNVKFDGIDNYDNTYYYTLKF